MSNQLTMLAEGPKHPKRVFFEGSTAVLKGQGYCYNVDATGTGATAADESRMNRVELPSQTNCHNFAGVAAQAYPAKASGQWITIYEPGSVCEVLCPVATTVGATRITCSTNAADYGRFTYAGFNGRGTAVALQTNAALLAAATSSVGPVASNVVGGVSINNVTVTWSGIETYAAAGDTFVCLGSKGNTAGTYTISVVAANTLTLATTPQASAAAEVCGAYVVRGYPTVLARLEDGIESGLQMVTQADLVGSALESTPTTATGQTGYVYIVGGITPTTGDTVLTLAAGLYPGQRKCYYLKGTIETHDAMVTSSVLCATTSAKAWALTSTAELDTAGENCLLVWNGTYWCLTSGICTVA